MKTPRSPDCEGSIKYKKDKTVGWIPAEWSIETKGQERYEYKVTDYAINEKIDPARFAHEFPPGTPVADQSDLGPTSTMRYSVVQPDGSRLAISQDDYLRLRGLPNPPKKRGPPKQQVK
jgi:hypothetical protein